MKRRYLISTCVMLLTFVAPFFMQGASLALSCPDPTDPQLGGRCLSQGYFTNAPSGPLGTAIYTWQKGHDANSAQPIEDMNSFFNVISTDLNRPFANPCFSADPINDYNLKGAFYNCANNNASLVGTAFMVDVMLGRSGTQFTGIADGIQYAKDNYNTFVARVKAYNAAGRVTWRVDQPLYCGRYDTLAFNFGADAGFFQNGSPSDTNPASPCNQASAETIVFYDTSGNPQVTINKICGNLNGLTKPLDDIQSGFNLGATSTTSFDSKDKPTTVTFDNKVTVTNSGPNGVQNATENRKYYIIRAAGGTTTINYTSLTHLSPASPPGNMPDNNADYGAGTVTDYVDRINAGGLNLQVGDQVCTTITYPSSGQTHADGTIASSTNSTTPPGCQTVINEPYLEVYGGDVWAGRGVNWVDPNVGESSATCPVGPGTTGISSWNTEGSNNWAGAGTQFAAGALDLITDFRTNTGAAPTNLGFANDSTGVPNTGGKLDASNLPNCSTDFLDGFEGVGDSPPTIYGDVDKLVDAPTDPTSPNVPDTIPAATSLTVYVQGDVYINNNIVYDRASGLGWGNIATIPSFRLIVEGNIYIDSSVTQLDGLYYAAPDLTGAGGNIYTCAEGFKQNFDPVNDTANYYNNCNSQLVVNGSFMAKQVQFQRTCGTVSDSGGDQRIYTGNNCSNPNHAAEVFNYSPEMWLAMPSPFTIDSSYDGVTGLPPIL